MRRTLILIIPPGLLTTLSIAEGVGVGKIQNPARSAPTAVSFTGHARVRAITHRRGTDDTKGAATASPQNSATSISSATSVTSLSSIHALLPIVQKSDIQKEDQVFLDRVLRKAPALCRESIEHLIVRYPVESLKASDIERGQATATTMILRGPLASLPPKEQAEMIGVIFHECGHIVDLGALKGSPHSGKSAYPDGHVPTYNDDPSRFFYEISWRNVTSVRPDAEDADFVSGYAQADPFEDLAESFVYFALHKQAFHERAAKNPILVRKLQWLETYVFKDDHAPIASESWPAGRPVRRSSESEGGSLGEGWDGRIAWDVTKLSHSFSF